MGGGGERDVLPLRTPKIAFLCLTCLNRLKQKDLSTCAREFHSTEFLLRRASKPYINHTLTQARTFKYTHARKRLDLSQHGLSDRNEAIGLRHTTDSEHNTCLRVLGQRTGEEKKWGEGKNTRKKSISISLSK